MKTLHLPTDLEREIRAHCEDSSPQEACGLLLGHSGEDGAYHITKIIPSPNLSNRPERAFDIDPALIIHHQKQYRAGGDKIIGHYHSHPDGQAQPSRHDREQNYDADLIWLIIQVTDSMARDMAAFATDPESGQLTPILLAQA